MRPKTGEILALANRPNFNPNQQEGVPPLNRKNRAIMSIVEPGSTFKIVTTAAALALGLVKPDTAIYCENGYFAYCGKLHDHRPYGDLTVNEILVKSSNIGVAKLGDPARRAEVLRVRAPLRFRRAHRRRAARRNRRDRPSAAPLEQDFHHAHAHGPGGRRHAAADRHGHVRDRQWRAPDDAADRARDRR